jgi:hypothetical protein
MAGRAGGMSRGEVEASASLGTFFSSTSEFQEPHSLHLPFHLSKTAPHSLHIKMVFSLPFAMNVILRHNLVLFPISLHRGDALWRESGKENLFIS